MAKNTGKGYRKGAVDQRSQTYNCDFWHKLARSSTINWLRNNENTSFQGMLAIEFSIITWH
ncbi:hypothetical protein [Chamaesiphon minutus]|uniref:hypothetical protein n=1 Tax=Chamaesiphon minutus TaxID=1173032 RepID=UPI0005A300F1|nr:hypothetical protein [Chamaesiphon minutus]